MKKRIEIFCTLGPSSLNKSFLKFASNNIDLLRLNMSHLSLSKLEKNIKFIKNFSKSRNLIDTEGAQIRTKCKRVKFLKKIKKLKLQKLQFFLYPSEVISKNYTSK